MNKSIVKILKYLLIPSSALLIGLFFSSIITYFELSKISRYSLVIFFIVFVSAVATLVTINNSQKEGQRIWIKLLSIFLGWFATVTIALVLCWYYLFHGGGEVGYYIPQEICSREARHVIQEFGIQKVHSCKTEDTIFRNRKAKLVSLEYNLAGCFEKCVYNFRQAIVQDGHITEIVPEIVK